MVSYITVQPFPVKGHRVGRFLSFHKPNPEIPSGRTPLYQKRRGGGGSHGVEPLSKSDCTDSLLVQSQTDYVEAASPGIGLIQPLSFFSFSPSGPKWDLPIRYLWHPD